MAVLLVERMADMKENSLVVLLVYLLGRDLVGKSDICTADS